MPFDTRRVPHFGRPFLLAVLLTLSSTAAAQTGGAARTIRAPATGSVCLLSIADPTPGEKSLYNYAGGTPTPDYSVQIGKGSVVAILESFRLRFEEKDRGRLSLFLNELYVTWQRWSADRDPPACRCKGAKITHRVAPRGGALLSGADASSQPRPLFTQRERQSPAAARPNPRCKPEPYETPITYSELTVFESREVVFQSSTVVPCLGEVGDPPFAGRWAPSGTASVFRHTLSVPEFEQFKAFLDRADVQGLQSFMNAGPGVGDFKIAIARPGGPQTIDVASLSPDHFQRVRDPSLIHLVCKAKEMARMASRSGELPEWCRTARPLNPSK
jgi:hypothetical protein